MLILKKLPINSYGENIAYIHKDCSDYHVSGAGALTKIEIHGGVKPVYAFLQIVDDARLVKPTEIALNNEAFRQLNLPSGANLSITTATPPPSIGAIRRKMSGNILSSGEYNSIINDITSRRYSNMDITSFLVASGSFMAAPEILSLTEALVDENTFSWDNESIVVDHHCLGGVPGNKTDLIITPIIAAYGLPMPKTSAHSLTSCSGVADTMGVLCNSDLDTKTFIDCIKKNRGAIGNYDTLGISNANKLIADVERQIGISQQEHIVASILAIKLSAGITHLLIDIPVGPQSRIKTTNEAMRLRKLIEYVGDMLSLEVEAVITDGSEPIGNGVGAVLEARDVMKVLRNKEDAPQDLREKSLFLAGRILEFDPQLRGGQGYAVAKEILASGKALEVMNNIIYSQGKASQPQLGHLTREVISPISGVVESIDNSRINKIGIEAGAGQYAGAGLDLLKKVGDEVNQGDILFRLHACTASDFAYANSLVEGYTGYDINPKANH